MGETSVIVSISVQKNVESEKAFGRVKEINHQGFNKIMLTIFLFLVMDVEDMSYFLFVSFPS